jgi:Ribonuclease G/E
MSNKCTTEEMSIREFYEQEITRLLVESMRLWNEYQEYLKKEE